MSPSTVDIGIHHTDCFFFFPSQKGKKTETQKIENMKTNAEHETILYDWRVPALGPNGMKKNTLVKV